MTPTTVGIPSARATITMCELAAPSEVTIAAILSTGSSTSAAVLISSPIKILSGLSSRWLESSSCNEAKIRRPKSLRSETRSRR
ncbi:hypothetical protein D9M71_591230 [compost metagenome]